MDQRFHPGRRGTFIQIVADTFNNFELFGRKVNLVLTPGGLGFCLRIHLDCVKLKSCFGCSLKQPWLVQAGLSLNQSSVQDIKTMGKMRWVSEYSSASSFLLGLHNRTLSSIACMSGCDCEGLNETQTVKIRRGQYWIWKQNKGGLFIEYVEL